MILRQPLFMYIPGYVNLKKRKTVETVRFNGLGGDKRDRTADLLNAIQALSQLSYTPWCG